MKNQESRRLTPEIDSLRFGNGWSIDDLNKTNGIQQTPEEVDRILSERRMLWSKPASRHTHGILDIFTHNSASPMKGAYIENRNA